MRNLLALTTRAAKSLNESFTRRTDARTPHQRRQAAATELYVYRLRHFGASIDDVAADLGVGPRTLQSWVHSNWTW